jgi:hypothetical protein
VIVNIRGTNGAGKSHIVRQILLEMGENVPIFGQQKNPIGLSYGGLFVAGHYSIGNGGFDTLRCDVADAWELVADMARTYDRVLCEGKNQSADVDYAVRAALDCELTVVHLTTTLEQCVASVRARGHTLAADSVARTYRKCERDANALARAGIQVLRLNREDALAETRRLLCLTS